MGRWGIRGLETRVKESAASVEGESDCTVEVYMSEEFEEGVTVLRQGEAPRVRAAKSFEFGQGKL